MCTSGNRVVGGYGYFDGCGIRGCCCLSRIVSDTPVSVSRIGYASEAASGADPSDEQIARALERIATELERAQAAVPADQRDNPQAIRDALLRHPPQRLDPVGVAACVAALGEFLITTGIPAAKIIKIIRDAKKIYGSLTQAIKAIKTNADAATLGEESITVLQKIVGIDGVIAKCSGI